MKLEKLVKGKIISGVLLYLLFIVLIIPARVLAVESYSKNIIHHEMRVTIHPDAHRFTVHDSISIPVDYRDKIEFLLHRDVNPSSSTPGVSIIKEKAKSVTSDIESFRVKLPPNQRGRDRNSFIIEYGGIISHSIESYGKEHARGFSQTAGIISEEGVYLAGSTFWYPVFDGALLTFTLNIELPQGWDAISQGTRKLHVREKNKTFVQWESPEPQDVIFIVAARFIEYTQDKGRLKAMVFLRKKDDRLARKYLGATFRYIEMYEKLIGAYPYSKFALVENFWETGYGMPSFTLLGPKVIRLPFILYSSYPHEILHNWWGNSVYPDPASGNWSEGLTAYLSDHLMKSQKGRGAEYRLETLQKYTDYVKRKKDFPLAQFRFRHSSPTEAIGYGKSMMFFHMLRKDLGDEIFIQGLKAFYMHNKFRFASFDDIRKSLESVSGKNLKIDFDQWLTRTDAPELKISNVKAIKEHDGYILRALFEQTQKGDPYSLNIPVVATMKGKKEAFQTVFKMKEKQSEFKTILPARPLRVDVDPEFDLFRRLEREEIPPALTQTFGSDRVIILLPSSSNTKMIQAYRRLSLSLSKAWSEDVKIKLDKEYDTFPSDRTVILLGWENSFLGKIKSALSEYNVKINKDRVHIGKNEIQRNNNSIVLTVRNTENKDAAVTWIASDIPEALPLLGRKLPHYHKYSYLAFKGSELTNTLKGRWQVTGSPMTVFVPREDGTFSNVKMGAIEKEMPIATLPPVFSTEPMMGTINFLSSSELKGRGLGTEGLDIAAEFIAKKFEEAGLKPAGDIEGSYFQIWRDQVGSPARKASLKNIIGVIPGSKSEFSDQSVVVAAHYDHLGLGWPYVREERFRGMTHPGADDNASGVAVLIELARVLSKSLKPDRNVVFVAFTGEEAEKKGSKYYVASQRRYPVKKCIGMINLDTVGRLEKRKLLVLGAQSAREWQHIFRGAGYVTGVDIKVVPEELDASDQKSFQEAGVPAVQIFSGPHLDYHRPTDTPDKIDPEGLIKVASVIKEVIEYLANREEMLTTVKSAGDKKHINKGTRKVSLGIIPDFAFTGKGCRLDGVVPGSPAESCGLKGGDVILRINTNAVQNLRDLSNILKSLKPGERISITFLREGKQKSVEAEVVGR